ncbi:MAG: hypothetical protein DRI23_10825, partial [Candidatus Cloacimonadota bacterium]
MIWKNITHKELIGTGAFGDVFKVTNPSGQLAALKVINKEFYNYEFQFRSAFENAKKIDDPNCLKMYEWISDKEVSWTMEYIDGKPISSLKFTDNLSLDQILKTMIQVCNGLIALHSRNIIHRDLKPENILIDSNGYVKITDFDFIKTGFSEKQLGRFFGTPEYASPEHFIASYELDTRSDLYSLGVILYELLTGELPFTGKTAKESGDQHRIKPLVLPSKLNPAVPAGVERIIIGLLEKDPKDRYQHVHAVARDLWKELKGKKGLKLKSDVSYLLKPKFVNRTTPLRTLNKLSDKLKSNHGNIVLILGESGIGKSKLVQQFYYQLQLHDIAFHKSICKTVESSFKPLNTIFEEIISNKSETEKLECFGQFGWDLVKAGILAEQSWMKKIRKPINLSGQNAEIRLFGAITDLLKKAASKPIVICIDDLHWADDQILKWLQYASRNLQDFPILIIGLHRTEMLFEDSILFQIENLTQIKIKNLKEIDVSEMIKSMLGKKRRNRAMIDFTSNIVSHTKGNPLFIREMLYHLNEQKIITIENSKWKFPPKLVVEKLPDTIQEIIQSRLEELSFESLQTLQIASIIGKKFDFEMLLHLTQKKENELLEDLIDCREVSLLEESGNDLVFIHDKIREVLEDKLKKSNLEKWKVLHQKAGEFLEEKYSQNIDEALDELANHFYKAEDEEKSIKYLELAGDKARKNYQNEKALLYYERFIKILNKKLEFNCNNEDRELQKKLCDAFYLKAEIFYQTGRVNEAIPNYLEALKIAEKMIFKKDLSQISHCLGWCYLVKENREKALIYLKKGLKIAKELDLNEKIAVAYGSIGTTYSKKKDWKNYLKYQNKCIDLSKKINFKLGTAACINIGVCYLENGDYDKAIDNFQEGVEISNEINYKWQVAAALYNIGLAYRHKGEFAEALDYTRKSLRIGKEIGDNRHISLCLKNLGDIKFDQKEFKLCLDYYDQAIKLRRQLDLV